MLHIEAMVKAARALSAIRIENDYSRNRAGRADHHPNGICEPNDRGIVVLRGWRSVAARGNAGLGLRRQKGKSARPTAPLGFRSAIHRRERFWTREQPAPRKETAGL
jgi:hypothetical protein